MSSMQEEKRALQLEQQGLDNIQRGEYRSFILQYGLLKNVHEAATHRVTLRTDS